MYAGNSGFLWRKGYGDIVFNPPVIRNEMHVGDERHSSVTGSVRVLNPGSCSTEEIRFEMKGPSICCVAKAGSKTPIPPLTVVGFKGR